jgi:RNA polymerase sigma factor (sigma-70 family)
MRYGHGGIASSLQPLPPVYAASTEEPVAATPEDVIIEGWEAEEEFQAPIDGRFPDEDVIALQAVIASHRIRREHDDWETAEISLPAGTGDGAAAAIPETIQSLIACGLAAGWLADDAVTAAWPRAKPEHRQQLLLLLASMNIRVFAVRPGNPFQFISDQEPGRRDLRLSQEALETFRDVCASRLETAERYKSDIAGFASFSPDREARIFTKVADARARLVDAFSGFLQMPSLALQGELAPTADVGDDYVEVDDDDGEGVDAGADTTPGKEETTAPELFLRDFIKLFGELEQNVSDKRDLESLRLALDGYRKARDRAMEGGLKLVPWLAHRYRRRGLPVEDLIQEGNIGLMRAVEKFDITKGSRFGTYAVWWIRQAMLRAIQDQSRLLRIPVHIGEFVRKTERIRQRVQAEFGRDATVEEIAGELEVSPGKIRNVLAIPEPCLPAVLRSRVDDSIPLPDRRQDLDDLRTLTSEMLLMLPARTEHILRLRFGMGGLDEHTLEEVGEKFDVTRERIRQIEAKGLRALRHPNRSKKLVAFL